MFSVHEITGQSRSHIIQHYSPRFAAHKEAAESFLDMRSDAMKEGFCLHPFSSFRDFNTQLRIWNQKFSGKKPLYTRDGQKIDYASLTEEDLIHHILAWSALPGTSRHHWGTDIDVVDLNAVTDDYSIKLLPEEIEVGGVFHPLHCWLNDNIHRYNYFRPYETYKGGMYPEPWQLSYAPIATTAINEITIEILSPILEKTTIAGKQQIFDILPSIFTRHIYNIDPPK